MSHKVSVLVVLVLGIGVSAMADEYGPVPRQVPPATAPRIVSPAGPVYSLGTPSPERPPIEVYEGHSRHHGAAMPPAGWSGYGFGGIPTYQWGYFGAKYHAVKIYHRGYYGHRMSYGYRRGY